MFSLNPQRARRLPHQQSRPAPKALNAHTLAKNAQPARFSCISLHKGRYTPTLSDRILMQGIRGYQRFISPYKGFSCAHRRVYGGISCSAYVKQAIAQMGWKKAFPLVRQRFKDCRRAHDRWHSDAKYRRAMAPDHPQPPHFSPSPLSPSPLFSAAPHAGAWPQSADPEASGVPPGDLPAEQVTAGEYQIPEAEQTPPPSPDPNPLGSCCACAAVDACCGGISGTEVIGCGDPLEACSCCF